MKPHFHFHLLPWVCRAALLVFLAVAITGCLAETGPEPTGTDSGTSSDGTTEQPAADGSSSSTCASFVFGGFDGTRTDGANWESIQADIFAGSGGCTNCHTGDGNGPSDLSLDSDQFATVVTDHLVSGYSTVDLAIIEPGSRECSFLYVKVSTADDELASNDMGSRMPLGKTPLSDADIELIGTWIDEGAVETAE